MDIKNPTPHEKACLDYAIAQAHTQLETALLDNAADFEYRICLLELGIDSLQSQINEINSKSQSASSN